MVRLGMGSDVSLIQNKPCAAAYITIKMHTTANTLI
jgi:hypothetical protein